LFVGGGGNSRAKCDENPERVDLTGASPLEAGAGRSAGEGSTMSIQRKNQTRRREKLTQEKKNEAEK